MNNRKLAKTTNSAQTTAFQRRFNNFVALCMAFSPLLGISPLGQKRNADAITFKGNRTIKRRHFRKPAATDDNKNGRTVFYRRSRQLFPHIAAVS
jgi:hypothetical protein